MTALGSTSYNTGMTKTREITERTRIYQVWYAMIGRCQKENFGHAYQHYSKRGITVCSEWQEFEPFYVWAKGNGYERGLSLDRIDNDAGYSPSNCRWATERQQAQNRSNSILTDELIAEIRTKYLAGRRVRDLAEEYGVGHPQISRNIADIRLPRKGRPNGPQNKEGTVLQ